MIKFISLKDIEHYKDWYIMHSVSLDKKKIPSHTKINKDIIRQVGIINYQESLTDMIVITDKENSTDKELRTFLDKFFREIITKELDVINTKYYGILDDEFNETVEIIIIDCLETLHIRYSLLLSFTPIVLKKTIDLTILSFYFGLKVDLKYSEIKDLIYSALLCNISLCVNKTLQNIDNKEEVIKELNNDKLNSFQYISSDLEINNNIKRIIKTYNNSTTEAKEKVLPYEFKDILVEILWLSNDLLTYDFNTDKAMKSLYNNDKYSMITNEASSFLNTLKSKKQKNILQKIISYFRIERSGKTNYVRY